MPYLHAGAPPPRHWNTHPWSHLFTESVMQYSALPYVRGKPFRYSQLPTAYAPLHTHGLQCFGTRYISYGNNIGGRREAATMAEQRMSLSNYDSRSEYSQRPALQQNQPTARKRNHARLNPTRVEKTHPGGHDYYTEATVLGNT